MIQLAVALNQINYIIWLFWLQIYSEVIMASLAEKLSALTNPGPEFKDLEEEEEDKVTGAKVTDGDLEGEDEEEEELGRSYLRTVTAGGLEGDDRTGFPLQLSFQKCCDVEPSGSVLCTISLL